ncbi:MAG TPA: hypothetical protein VF941_23450 [Clostridia bacterium]
MEILKLYCEKKLVGFVKQPFFSDDTWYGVFETAILDGTVDFEKRIMYFINFSRDWNRRIEEDCGNLPDASEFDQFDDLINNSSWVVETHEGNYNIDKAPVFYGNEISWRIIDK